MHDSHPLSEAHNDNRRISWLPSAALPLGIALRNENLAFTQFHASVKPQPLCHSKTHTTTRPEAPWTSKSPHAERHSVFKSLRRLQSRFRCRINDKCASAASLPSRSFPLANLPHLRPLQKAQLQPSKGPPLKECLGNSRGRSPPSSAHIKRPTTPTRTSPSLSITRIWCVGRIDLSTSPQLQFSLFVPQFWLRRCPTQTAALAAGHWALVTRVR